MPRLLFEKTGNAVWMSHLDLMRLFQRAFKRAGLSLTHTQGFNPRPSVSIALPLSVGVESVCELLDFDLDGVGDSNEEIKDKLNRALVSGVRVLDVYDNGAKIKNLAYLSCTIRLTYDSGVPSNAVAAIKELFSREMLTVEKRGKNGISQQDIIPLIKKIDVAQTDANAIEINAMICCQNPSLNPAQIIAAIDNYLPEYSPDFCRFGRTEIFDTNENVFR